MKSKMRWVLVVGLTLVAAVLCIWSVPYVPTNDGPQHLLSARMENEFVQPESIYPDFLDPAPALAARGFSLVYGPLSELFSWAVALKLTLCFMVGLLALGLWFLAVSIDRRRAPLGLLALVIPLGWPFYMGFYRFVIGQYFGLFVLGLAYRWRKPQRLHFVILGALLLLQAHLHLFPALVSGLCIGVLILVRDSGRDRLRHLGALSLAAMPTLAVLWFTTRDDAATIGTQVADQTRWVAAGKWIAQLPALIAPGAGWRAGLVLALVLCGLVVGLRAGLQKKHREQLALVTTAFLLFLLGIFAPMDIPGWQFLAPRFLGTATFLAIVGIPLEDWTVKSQGNGGEAGKLLAFLLLPLMGLYATWNLHQGMYSACSDSLSQLEALGGRPPMHTSGLKLPMVFGASCKGERIPYVKPELHAGALFAAAEGGLVPHLFMGAQGVHTFTPKNSAPWPPIPGLALWGISQQEDFHTDRSLRARAIADYVGFGRHYGEVLLFGARDEDFTAFAARGYLWERRSGSFGSGKFVGCSLPLEFDAADVQGQLHLTVQQLPERLVFLNQKFPPPPPNAGLVTIKVERLICGAVRLGLADRGGEICGLDLHLGSTNAPVRCARSRPQPAEISQ